ncbi:MAG: putative glycoside hydrolase [Campylobacterales bacterium]
MKIFLLLIVSLSLFGRELYVEFAHEDGIYEDVSVICNDKVYALDQGVANIDEQCNPIIKAPGYKVIEDKLKSERITLEPFDVRGVFVSFYGISSKKIMNSIYPLIDEKIINTLVIEVKADDGKIAFDNNIALAKHIGANSIKTIKEPKKLIEKLHQKGIYTIAKIAVFKDGHLPVYDNNLAVKKGDGTLYRDRQNVTWSDPFSDKAKQYNIEVAKLASDVGFDEIMFDYVRFPDRNYLSYAKDSNQSSRVEEIEKFLKMAKDEFRTRKSFLSAAIFGYTAWESGDTGIGQQIESVGRYVDYLNPMLYPSGFSEGIPYFRDPIKYPYEVIFMSLKNSIDRSGLNPRRFRPWLQAFRDYAFNKQNFGIYQIKRQIQAADDTKTSGWLLWNARNRYLSLYDYYDDEHVVVVDKKKQKNPL